MLEMNETDDGQWEWARGEMKGQCDNIVPTRRDEAISSGPKREFQTPTSEEPRELGLLKRRDAGQV